MRNYSKRASSGTMHSRGSAFAVPVHEEIAGQEVQAGLARHRREAREERRRHSLEFWAGFWPVVLGFILACFAPQLRDFLAQFRPWVMGAVFPFAVLAGRPELHLGTTLESVLPQVMLYAQFPLEGLLATIAFSGRVTIFSGTARMAYCHAMAATLLLLVSGVAAHMAGY
jgi:hypothetical protein